MDELFDKMIYRALKKRATDIHMILKENLTIRFRIFGQLEKYDCMDNDVGSKLMNYIKYRSLINTNYRLLPQTGDFSIHIHQKEYFLRISYLPSQEFESIVIRILNNHEIGTIQELTYQEDVCQYLTWLSKQESGLFLISGATGSGKSTTLYTILKEIIQHNNKNIITIEDPIEMHLENCLQIELNEKLGITYHDTLRQILRHDPDVIMIGEIRDVDTAKIAITCALTGHLVLTTIHASNAILSLKRLMNLEINETDICDVMIGAMSQKMKYDEANQRVIVLSELMNRQQILSYFQKNVTSYMTFAKQAQKLINQGFDQQLFLGECKSE
ncbi:ATPase, T2SS/T4P/T4SS family [Candidatus Stoquefichus massiliensis]|uniref:ATPase, T2SS/T4P/T4SS family n=1 Tax=Candidatus Stoquefichus massiliensis TaxID=1470350 RepID=UPI00047F6AD5|nr:ATPase, T2SS/T4P/T4SS family [Candidatus Stoquefichus massiliensis]